MFDEEVLRDGGWFWHVMIWCSVLAKAGVPSGAKQINQDTCMHAGDELNKHVKL
jgi:hypothetical protein